MADALVRSRLEAIVINFKDGFTVYHDIKMIRLKGKDINLLIMEDYMPTLGEIDGRVEIIGNETITLEDVSGFFVVKNNVFKLLEKEKTYAE